MIKAITLLIVTVSFLSLGACADKKETCTMTKVSTTHGK